MERTLVICPETGCLEAVDLEHTEHGVLVDRCSRLVRCGLQCDRRCAARIDLQELLDERCNTGEDRVEIDITETWPETDAR